MVDIQSATATLTASTPSSASTVSLTPVQAVVTNLPAALSSLDRSVQINATPAALSATNELTLITALGNVTVNLALQVSAAEKQILLQQLLAMTQAQKPVTLSLQPGTPPSQAVLLIPNLSLPAATQTSNSALPTSGFNLPVPHLAVGETLSAIVLPSLPQQQLSAVALLQEQPISAPASSLEFPAAAPLSVQFDAVQQTQPELFSPNYISVPLSEPPETAWQNSPSAPVNIPQLQPTPAVMTVLQPAEPPLPALQFSIAVANVTPAPAVVPPLPQPSPPLANLLQPGNAVTVRVDAIIVPPVQNSTSALPLPPLAPNQIAATVSGTGADGQLILKAGDTTLFVKTPATAPIGSTAVLTVEVEKPEPLLVLPQNNPTNFQSLPQAVAALAQSDPQMLAQIMATRLPQPTAYLPGALLFLFSAFKQGNVGGWLGENAIDSLIRAGKADIIANLTHELNSAGQLVQDPIVGEWRTYPIPLYSGQQFQALTLYVHSDREARKDQSTAPPGTGKIRFLIDMRLSKLGVMQLDGFVQPKKLDMILRSEATLPEGLHNELRSSYIKALEAVGYTGALNFQVGRQHWMKMQKPAGSGVIT